MPAATNTFQQIAGAGPAPFNEFLRPHIPLDYATQSGGLPSNTGYEDTTTGTGKAVLAFLRSVQDERKRLADEDDRNTQFGLDNFRAHVARLMADPDLTDEGRKAIGNEADAIMNQHMHYAMKDVGKDGVHGIIKNVLTAVTGGGMKVREPINWNEATGRITNVRQTEHSQLHNYQDIVARAHQAVADMKRQKLADGDVPSKEDIEGEWAPFYREALGKAPSYADKIFAAAGMGGLGASTYGYMAVEPPEPTPTGTPGTSETPETPIPTTAQPPVYSPSPIADTGAHVREGGYPVIRSAFGMGPTQPPLTAGTIPIPPGISGALAGPMASFAPKAIADTSIPVPQGGGYYKALRSGQQYPLTMPLTGVSGALTGPFNPPDFTKPGAGFAAGAPAPAGVIAGAAGGGSGPAVGTMVRTKDGVFKIKARNPDGTFEVE